MLVERRRLGLLLVRAALTDLALDAEAVESELAALHWTDGLLEFLDVLLVDLMPALLRQRVGLGVCWHG